MSSKKSAGILMFRKGSLGLEFLLVHPGGPFWAKKDQHAWSIPKGEFEDEEPLEAAKRELTEETGAQCDGELIPLGALKQPSGKIIHAWALEQDFEPLTLRSNTFEFEWPPRSGKTQSFPEVDSAKWFSATEAKDKIVKGQWGFAERILELMEGS